MAPLSSGAAGFFAEVDGYAPAPDEEVRIESSWVGPKYFEALGIDLREGRSFSASDGATAPQVAIINETMARRYWAGRNPIGGHVRVLAGVNIDVQVVGVARDVTHGLVGAPEPFVYLPIDQHWTLIEQLPFALSLMATGASQEMPLVTTTRDVLHEVDPRVPLLEVTTLEMRMADLLMPQRVGSVLMSALAALTIVLVAVGIVGAVGYSVSRRRMEIGIRLALGARRSWVRF